MLLRCRGLPAAGAERSNERYAAVRLQLHASHPKILTVRMTSSLSCMAPSANLSRLTSTFAQPSEASRNKLYLQDTAQHKDCLGKASQQIMGGYPRPCKPAIAGHSAEGEALLQKQRC